MRTLYTYVMERASAYARYEDIVKLKEIYMHTYDETNPPSKLPNDVFFIIKKSQPNQLCIRNVNKNDGCELLSKVLGVPMGDFDTDRYNNGTITPKNPDLKPIRIHITDKTIGTKIQTKDQETATCIVFNTVVEKYNNGQEYKGIDQDEILGILLEALDVDFRNTGWYETFALQVDKIINALGGIDNAKEYRMERFGGHDKYKPADWKLWESYHVMTLDYTRFMGGQKDNWDPTDVILYRKDRCDELGGIFNDLDVQIKSLNPGDSVEFVVDTLRNLYRDKSKPFMGISLKKLGNSASLEYYNMTNGDRINIKQDPKTIVTSTRRGNKGIYTLLEGDYKFEDVVISGDIQDAKPHIIKLELRTFGAGINALDVTLESGPSIGKCPTNIWTKILKVRSTDSIEKCVDAFRSFMDDPDMDDVNRMVQAAAKNGPHCLPFILIH